MKTGRIFMTVVGTGLILAALPASARAPSSERPVIRDARIYTDGSILFCDLTSSGMLSDRITGTVKSGLPAVVELFYHLKTKGRGISVEGIHSWSLRYDVWEDIYSVSDGDTTVTIESIEAMDNMISRLKGISLIPFSRLTGGKRFMVKFSIAVNPLSGSEGEQVEGWIEESAGVRQESSWREQVLNVNDLISNLFSKSRDAASRSEWFEIESAAPEQVERIPGRND
jgi:hypothetical protein